MSISAGLSRLNEISLDRLKDRLKKLRDELEQPVAPGAASPSSDATQPSDFLNELEAARRRSN